RRSHGRRIMDVVTKSIGRRFHSMVRRCSTARHARQKRTSAIVRDIPKRRTFTPTASGSATTGELMIAFIWIVPGNTGVLRQVLDRVMYGGCQAAVRAVSGSIIIIGASRRST